MQPLISVIIPLYNGEKYIVKCLDSIREQRYFPAEIIIVNDASPDNSVEIIKEYGEINSIPVKNFTDTMKESNVETVQNRVAEYNMKTAQNSLTENSIKIVLVSKKNQGQGAARNTGVEMASGKYLTFLDQDDTLEPGILQKMVETAEKENADIVSAGYRRVTPDGKVTQEVRLQQTEWSKYKVIAPWSKLYRTEFIKKNSINFLSVVLGEDIYFLMQAYSYAPKVAFLGDIGYNWLDNATSVSNTAHKELAEDTSLLKLYEMLEALENREVLKKDKLYEYFLLKTAIWDILYTSRSNAYQTVLANNAKIWEWFEHHFENYKKNPYVRIGKPQGESLAIRMIVWGYMKIKKWRLEELFLQILSRK